ncbi:exportin-6 isoform X9 [Papio anubis]|uniref:exportin-6 isoform X9 n=2 Tax=Papio anubis TaxID=9555 RepID=UPI000B7B38AD|nr:exportin-6 isoform X9 [Papio anubis]
MGLLVRNRKVVNGMKGCLSCSYIEKFTDFLRLFVSVHLRRIESYSQFPVVEFLTLLFKYTFHQPTHEGYFSCLDIWTLFLDYLTSKIKSRLGDKEAVLNRYEDALVLLLTEVLNRIQFRYNQAQLEELDDETLDDDQQTEWQRYLRQSLEVVAKVMELLPTHAFSTLFPVLQDNLEVYLGLQQFIVTSGSGHRLNITAENDCRRLHCSLRDLSSLLQAVGRLAEYFIGDVFAARFNDALTVVERLVKVTLYGSQIKLYNIETAVPSVLKPDLIDVHAQSLAALQAYSHWLAQYCSEVHRQNTQQFVTLISTTMDAITPLISTKVQDKLLLSACHLLVSLATTVRPVFLISIPAVQKVFNRITDASAQRLVDKAQVLVCRALSNILLLPWPNLPENEQQWPVRSINHASLISALSRDYRNLKPSAVAPQRKMPLDDTKVIIHQTLSVLEDIVENISGESTKSRQICYQSLQESVQVSLALFPAFIHQSDVTDEMLSFFLTLFRGLRVQMGVPFTEQIIQTFLNMFTREQLAESILHEGSTGCRVVEKFLKILQVVVQEPGQVFKPFLPSIIALCMEQVYPIIAERPSPDVKAELFELLFRTLHHNWRYFFKSTVLASVQRGISEEQMENEPQFSAIMQAFGQSFLQPDIHLFKQNLFYLETLNTKQKLYHKKIFRTTMLFQFVNVLLQVLVHKSHDLLQEEIGIAIYNMASVDFDGFFAAFLPEFLTSCDGVDANQKSVLGRNFKMDRLCPCLPGPALIHPECAQAGQRPALLQTLQRQPAPWHCEALGLLLAGDTDFCCCHLRQPYLPPQMSPRRASVTLLGFSHAKQRCLPLPLLHILPLPSRAGFWVHLSTGWCSQGIGAGGGLCGQVLGGTGKSHGGGPCRPGACGSWGRIAKDSSQQCHLLTIPAKERCDVGTAVALLSSLPRPNCLEISALCQRFAKTHRFVVFSSFHCDTKKLRSLMKRNKMPMLLF